MAFIRRPSFAHGRAHAKIIGIRDAPKCLKCAPHCRAGAPMDIKGVPFVEKSLPLENYDPLFADF